MRFLGVFNPFVPFSVSVPAPNEVSVERLEESPPCGDAQPMA